MRSSQRGGNLTDAEPAKRRQQIEKMMRDDVSGYWRDKALQREYAALLEKEPLLSGGDRSRADFVRVASYTQEDPKTTVKLLNNNARVIVNSTEAPTEETNKKTGLTTYSTPHGFSVNFDSGSSGMRHPAEPLPSIAVEIS